MVASMVFLKIYAMGVVILLGALFLNYFAKALNLPTWYDFVANPKFTFISIAWLFIGYPFCLGLLVLIVNKFFP
jgi:hypothetical protein